MDVERFVSNGLDALHDIAIYQDIIDHLVAQLVGGEIREAMSIEACVQESTFTEQFRHAPGV